ncbi:uncharacterized protein LOC100185044 isoform X2 [Ciona intestinalis]
MADNELFSSHETMLKSSDVPFIPEPSSGYDMGISTFSQVIFPDIPDFFPPEKDVTMSYILTEIEPTSRDWVGLFRVGWASPRDYTTYVWSPKPTLDESGNLSQCITFKAYQLPKDDSEFYQFCYVTRNGYVRGASTPFQFRLCTENDCLVEVEDESGMIILKTKSDALEDQLSKVNQEKKLLEVEMESLIQSKENLETSLKKVSTELSSVEEKYRSCDDKNKEMQASLGEATAEQVKLLQRLEKAEKRIEKTKCDLATAQNTIDQLHQDIKSLEVEVAAAKQDRMLEKVNYEEEIKIRELMMQEKNVEMNGLRDQIKTLFTIKEEMHQKSSLELNDREDAFKVVSKENETVRNRCASYKEERDLFKDQFTKSELARNEALKDKAVLEEKLDVAMRGAELQQEKVDAADEKIKIIKKEWKDLNKQHKHELNQLQGTLRNSTERANALEAAKKLLTNELSDTTATRDQLMTELNLIKKEKEDLVEELKGATSMVSALQCQLETLESKLTVSEKSLVDKDRMMLDERRRGEIAEDEMHQQLLLLRKQLEESDNAMAIVTSQKENSSTKDQKTQTQKKKDLVQAQAPKIEEQEFVINDLRSQVEDLTTRLSMGADAYKEKFVECHKLEKKVKKLKLIHKSTSSANVPLKTSTSTDGESTMQSNDGIMNKLEKLFLSIADPDAEEQEQSLKLQQKVDDMVKAVETEHARYRKYKQLYIEEKQKSATKLAASTCKQDELQLRYEDETERCKMLDDENMMLKTQLNEFIQSSTDAAVRSVMTGTPHKESSDSNDDGLSYAGATKAGFTNLCSKANNIPTYSSEGKSDSDETSQPTQTRSVPISAPRKTKVISRQPIRSPPVLSDVVTSSSHSDSTTPSHTEPRKKKGKNKKGKSRKSIRPIM